MRDFVSDFNSIESNSESNSVERNSDSNYNSNTGNSNSIPIPVRLGKANSIPIPIPELELASKSNSGPELAQLWTHCVSFRVLQQNIFILFFFFLIYICCQSNLVAAFVLKHLLITMITVAHQKFQNGNNVHSQCSTK